MLRPILWSLHREPLQATAAKGVPVIDVFAFGRVLEGRLFKFLKYCAEKEGAPYNAPFCPGRNLVNGRRCNKAIRRGEIEIEVDRP